MKYIIALLIFLGLAGTVQAGTVVVTIAGFTNLPATAPTGWVTSTTAYPGGASPNTSRTYTMNDADFQSMLTWLAMTQFAATSAGPATPTAGAIWQTWPQIWINGTKQAVAQFFTVPAQTPAPITIQ